MGHRCTYVLWNWLTSVCFLKTWRWTKKENFVGSMSLDQKMICSEWRLRQREKNHAGRFSLLGVLLCCYVSFVMQTMHTARPGKRHSSLERQAGEEASLCISVACCLTTAGQENWESHFLPTAGQWRVGITISAYIRTVKSGNHNLSVQQDSKEKESHFLSIAGQ